MTTDVSSALAAKSDQLNADDLIGGPIIIEITKVTNIGKGKEQPLIINYRNDDGKPWKPCKTMGRVMAQAWETTDGAQWIGHKVQLFRDPNVTFGSDKPGGIRISHLSHIDEPKNISVTKTRGKKGPYIVQPLVVVPTVTLEDAISDIEAAPTLEGMEFKYKAAYRAFPDEESRKKIVEAKDKKKLELTTNQGE